MAYHMDLKAISLDAYKEMIKTRILIPSWKPLLEDIDNRFEVLKEMGFSDTEQLLNTLKNKKKLEAIVTPPLLTAEYLTILKREINARQPSPNKFSAFQFIDSTIVAKLNDAGIKHTKQLFDKVLTEANRKKLAEDLQLTVDEVLLLTQITDLSRIQWVNHTFAYVLYKSGFNSAEKVRYVDPTKLYETIQMLNANKEYYKGNIGLNDMKILVEAAQVVPLDIEY